jgi:hypothetical protein
MTQAIERDAIYRGRRFQTETIELCVRWYITYRLSYRDLAAMMAERGIVEAHTTIMRWVLRYVRYARRASDGRGLYLLVMPNGGRYWRYNYRFNGKHKTLALGVHPDIPLEAARERHQIARSLLADGIDPSDRKRADGKYAFATARRGTKTPYAPVTNGVARVPRKTADRG